MNVKKIIRIHFEDKGQDFLWWDIEYEDGEPLGKVVNCGPCQRMVWVDVKVEVESCRIGQHPAFIPDTFNSLYILQYPIIKREESPAQA